MRPERFGVAGWMHVARCMGSVGCREAHGSQLARHRSKVLRTERRWMVCAHGGVRAGSRRGVQPRRSLRRVAWESRGMVGDEDACAGVRALT